MQVSQDAHEMTGRLFDPTIGSVSRLWQFWDGAVPPQADSIRNALSSVGLGRFLAGGDSALLDLGGIAKGYAVDRAADRLRSLGIASAIVNAGGDLSLIGKRTDGRPWRIAIRHPRERGAFLGYLDLEDVSVATSGDYEKFFFFDGRRYHHILDPRTGSPGGRCASVTVVTSNTCSGDALATGLFLLGPGQGLRTVEAAEGVDAVFVYADGESIAVSSGLAGRFGRFESE
jgi:thiamine biosynthesis lipoprotein